VEIRIQFKPPAAEVQSDMNALRNELVIRLQPDEAVYMKMVVKKPGLEMTPIISELDLTYKERYSDAYIPDAYERLILDCIRGDQQHFVRRDELRAAWAVFTPLLHAIEEGKLETLPYPYGSRGPVASDVLVSKAGFVKNANYIWSPKAADAANKL
jgi:glucose-6-phosphate 1-dehydrogenase